MFWIIEIEIGEEIWHNISGNFPMWLLITTLNTVRSDSKWWNKKDSQFLEAYAFPIESGNEIVVRLDSWVDKTHFIKAIMEYGRNVQLLEHMLIC